ncbi:DMT family transporter [Dongia sp.]|uniref:DMT family transporter n=1 Tax=Dongia sp. TaxID=1977262 RepID=UPI0035AE72E0
MQSADRQSDLSTAGIIGSQSAGRFAVIGSAIAWSTAGFFTRAIPLDGWTLLFWRGLFGALGIFLVILWLEGRAGRKSFAHLGRAGWLFVAASAVGMIFFINALRLTTVAHVAVIYAVVPFATAFLGWLVLRESPTRSALLAALAALIDVMVMVGLSAEGNWLGDLLALGMTFMMAAMMVIARARPGIPILPAACLSALFSGLACGPFATTGGGQIALADLTLLVLFGLVNSALGLALFTLGARRVAPVETALIGALDAPLAPVWVWLAFAEVPGSGTLLGGGIVFASVALYLLLTTRSR